MSTPLDTLREALTFVCDEHQQHPHPSIPLAALSDVQALLDAARDMAQAIEDAYGGFAFVPDGSFEQEALTKGRAALARFDSKADGDNPERE